MIVLNYQGSKSNNVTIDDGTCYSLNAMHGHDVHVVCYSIEGNGSRPSHKGSGYSDEGVSFTLNATEHHAVCYAIDSLSSNSMKSKNPHSGFHEENIVKTLDTNPDPTCNQGGNVIVQCYEGQNCGVNENTAFCLQAGRPDDHHIPDVCYDTRGNGDGKTVPTITGDHQNRVTDYTAICVNGGEGVESYQKVTGSLCAAGYSKLGTQEAANDMFVVDNPENMTYAMQGFGDYKESDQASACKARDWKDATDLVTNKGRKYVVRRLTPLECCRLQGFPDWWTEDVEGSDSAVYKLWGNGIALPCATDLLERIAKEIRK